VTAVVAKKHMVKVFSTPTCPYCHTLKEYLKERNVSFEDIDVSQDEAARNYMVEKTGKMEVPVVEIDGQIIEGFDKNKIVELLNIKE
jgi:glutaredoxin-like YruB-family protein